MARAQRSTALRLCQRHAREARTSLRVWGRPAAWAPVHSKPVRTRPRRLSTPGPERRKKAPKTAPGMRSSLDNGSPHKGSARSQPSGARPVTTAHKALLMGWDVLLHVLILQGYGVRPASAQMTGHFLHCVALRADLLPQYAHQDLATRSHTHHRVAASGAALRVTPAPDGDTTPVAPPDSAHPPSRLSTYPL